VTFTIERAYAPWTNDSYDARKHQNPVRATQGEHCTTQYHQRGSNQEHPSSAYLIRDQSQYEAYNNIAKHRQSHEEPDMLIRYAKTREEVNEDNEGCSICEEAKEALQEEQLHITR
jgi:hypothetical protein